MQILHKICKNPTNCHQTLKILNPNLKQKIDMQFLDHSTLTYECKNVKLFKVPVDFRHFVPLMVLHIFPIKKISFVILTASYRPKS